MMTLEMNGRVCELNFGIGFVRALDEKYYLESGSGMRFGNGLELKAPMLLTGDALTLAEFIHMGTAKMGDKRPTLKEIDDFVDSAEDIKKVFSDVVDELKKSNACKIRMENLEAELKKAEENLRAKDRKQKK